MLLPIKELATLVFGQANQSTCKKVAIIFKNRYVGEICNKSVHPRFRALGKSHQAVYLF